MVTTENLSPKAGLIAGGSLLVDYMLTVAVSVSSPVQMPSRQRFHLFILIIFTFPFCWSWFWCWWTFGATRISDIVDDSGLPFHCQYHCLDRLWRDPNLDGSLAYNATAHVGQTISGVSVISLIAGLYEWIRFPYSGVEAISNSVPFFKKPKAKNAASTLTIMALILGIMFAGITFLNYWVGVVPAKGITTLAQMAQAILGNSPVGQAFFYLPIVNSLDFGSCG